MTQPLQFTPAAGQQAWWRESVGHSPTGRQFACDRTTGHVITNQGGSTGSMIDPVEPGSMGSTVDPVDPELKAYEGTDI